MIRDDNDAETQVLFRLAVGEMHFQEPLHSTKFR